MNISGSERLKNYKEFYEPASEKLLNEQSARCMDCGVPFCQSGCPLGNVIPEFNDAVYKKQWEKAYRILTSTNNLPEFTGRICPAPCEVACNEALNGKGITIRNNERYIIETAYANGWVKESGIPLHRNGIKVAVVGSGPAGLACAWRLNQLGYDVTVYERDDHPGGLTMYLRDRKSVV